MTHTPYFRDLPSKKAVLMVHGIVGTPDHFDFILDKLPGDLAVRNILLPGHGSRTKTFGRSSMEQWKNYVNSQLQYLASRHDEITVIAHSMGCLFALEESLKPENKITRLVLLNPATRPRGTFTAVRGSLSAIFGHTPPGSMGEKVKNASSIELTAKIWHYIGWVPRYLELFREAKSTRELLGKVTVPTVAFISGKDELVSGRSAADFEPVGEVVTLPHSSHYAYDDRDKETILKYI